jgi:hypothetical protein
MVGWRGGDGNIIFVTHGLRRPPSHPIRLCACWSSAVDPILPPCFEWNNGFSFSPILNQWFVEEWPVWIFYYPKEISILHTSEQVSSMTSSCDIILELLRFYIELKNLNNSRGKYKRNECLINVCKSDKDLSWFT